MRIKAFTLAEVLVTISVIGVITAIILPIAMHSKPDEKVVKFKKGHSMLYQAVNKLLDSDKYFMMGDLGIKPNGEPEGDLVKAGFSSDESCNEKYVTTDKNIITYFCQAFADVVSVKEKKCSSADAGHDNKVAYVAIPPYTPKNDWEFTLEEGKKILDEVCNNSAIPAEIVTTDGISFYQTNPQATFGLVWTEDCVRLFGRTEPYLHIYKPFCMDIDGKGKGEAPFGYGIRKDGKILSGERADLWLAKDIKDTP